MKILYDSQVFDMQKSGGISRYFCEIMQNLPVGFDYNLATAYSQNIYLNENLKIPLKDNELMEKRNTFLPKIHFRGKGKLQKLRNKLLYSNFTANRDRDIEALKSQNFDVFHPTYYDPYFLNYIGNKPFVLTIHDMIHEKLPEMLCDVKTIANKKLLAQKAAHIIAISEQTKKDVMDILNIPESKISVIYHGTAKMVSTDTDVKNPYGTYLLFTGTRTIYKNFYFMLIALSDWLKSHADIKLVCTSSEFSDFKKKLVAELGLENQVIHVFFNSDAQMYSLYKNALAFVFPSYYEGFGISMLEAFEAGCPCILADASCFREIAGDAALYFEPKNKMQLISCAEQLLKYSELRSAYIKKGKSRVNDFSWKKAAMQTSEVYVRVIESGFCLAL